MKEGVRSRATSTRPAATSIPVTSAPLQAAATASDTILSLNNIEVIYDHVVLVLKGVSLTVPRQGIVAILGASMPPWLWPTTSTFAEPVRVRTWSTKAPNEATDFSTAPRPPTRVSPT